MIDSHCHLHICKAGEDELLARAARAGLAGLLQVGSDLASSRWNAMLMGRTGLPLEVRHVTLSAASLALYAASVLAAPGPMPWAALAWAAAGILAISACNFGVSFLLALGTAVDARGLDRPGRAGLHRVLGRAFREHPWRFLGPPSAIETDSMEKNKTWMNKI